MSTFQPRRGLALVVPVQKSASESVQSKNGLLLPSQDVKETLVRGKILVVDDPEGNFKNGDKVLISPDNIIGEFNSDSGKSIVINVNHILGKVLD